MIADKKKFRIGFTMLISFALILVIMFTPIFNGQNGLCFLDDLYNSMSKGSAYYVPAVKEQIKGFQGSIVDINVEIENAARAEQSVKLLKKAGIKVKSDTGQLAIQGDLGIMLEACLRDSDLMYKNDGDTLKTEYDYDEKTVIYTWHTLLNKTDKALTKQKNFKQAKAVALVNHKVVETAYNYYGIVAKTVQESLVILIFSLIFYVIYTLWYGFGLMFIFEGLGLKFDH